MPGHSAHVPGHGRMRQVSRAVRSAVSLDAEREAKLSTSDVSQLATRIQRRADHVHNAIRKSCTL